MYLPRFSYPSSIRSVSRRARSCLTGAAIHPSLLALVICAISYINLSSPALAKVDFLGYTGFTIPSEPVLPDKETHPSLWFDAGEIDALRDKRHGDAYAARLWEAVSGSDYLLAELPAAPRETDSKRVIHKYYGDMTRLAALNAFMGLMETDPALAGQYRQKAIAALLRSFDGPIYTFDPVDRGGPVDEIYRGVWAQNVSAAYDWLQPYLTPEQDEEIRERFAREADYLHERMWDFAEGVHNHLSKPAWGLGSLALAMSDHPRASEWLRLAIEATNANTRYYFSHEGLYREGSHYYVFSFINFVPFLYHYRNVAGIDCFPIFQPAFEWPILTRNSKGWMPNIEDAFIKPYPSHMVAAAYRDMSTILHDSAPLAQVLQWNFQTTDYSVFDRARDVTGFNYTGASWDYPLELNEYLTYDPAIEPAAPTADPVYFSETGQTVFKSAWNDASDSQLYCLFHAVPKSNNHEHYDMLSFIVQARGQMMVSDSGYTRSGYNEYRRWNWYLTPEAHNVAFMNGMTPQDPEEHEPAESSQRFSLASVAHELKTAPFYDDFGDHSRSITMVNRSWLVVADRLKGRGDSPVTLLLHGGRGNTQGDHDERTWVYPEDQYGPAAKLHAVFLSENGQVEDRLGELTYIKGDWARYPYAALNAFGNELPLMTILVPSAPEESGPEVERLSEGECLAARVRWQGRETILVHQYERRSRQLASGAVETDAAYACIQYDKAERDVGNAGALHALLLTDATQFVGDGKAIFTSSESVSMAVDYSVAGQILVQVPEGGGCAVETTVKVALPTALAGKTVSLVRDETAEADAANSLENVTATIEGDYLTLQISAGWTGKLALETP